MTLDLRQLERQTENQDDCRHHVGGTCEPYRCTPGGSARWREPRHVAWECDPSHGFDLWRHMARVPSPDHPGASLDCATTEDSP